MLTASLALTAVFAVASTPQATPHERLDRSDLFAVELRQDLESDLRQVEEDLGRSPPDPERAQLLLLAARLHRVAGDYVEANRRIDAAERLVAKDDYYTRLWIAVERRWNVVDRYSYPWGTFDSATVDAKCLKVDLDKANTQWLKTQQDIQTEMATVLGEGSPAYMTSLMRGIQLMFFSDIIGLGQHEQIMGGFQRSGGEYLPMGDDLQELGISTLERGIAIPHDPPWMRGERASYLRVRLGMPLLARQGNSSIPLAYGHCSEVTDEHPADDMVRALTALSCAEVGMFPGGKPEDLGHYVTPPRGSDFRQSIHSDLWDGVARIRAYDPAAMEDGERWLDLAETAFERAGSDRGRARIAYVRASAGLLALIEGGGNWRDVVGEFAVSQELAKDAGDHRGALRAAMGAVLAQAVGRRIVTARKELASIIDETKKLGAVGELVGWGHLSASLAVHVAFVRHEPTVAEALMDLAEALYKDAGFHFEAARLSLGRSTVQQMHGNQEGALLSLDGAAIHVNEFQSTCSEMSRESLYDRFTIASDRLVISMDSYDAKRIDSSLKDMKMVYEEAVGPRSDLSDRALALAFQEVMEEMTRIQTKVTVELGGALLVPGRSEQDRAELAAVMNQLNEAGYNARRLMVALGARSLIESADVFLVFVKDREKIVEDPDLPKQQWYEATAKRVRLGKSESQRLIMAKVLFARGDERGAHEQLMRTNGLVEESKALLADATVGNESIGKMMATQALGDEALRLRQLLSIRAYVPAAAAMASLREKYDKEGKRWFENFAEPWEHWAFEVDTLAGTGRHDEALASARELITAMDAELNLYDEKFNLTAGASTPLETVYATVIDAAVRARRPELVFEFSERARGRSIRERLTQEENPQLARIRDLGRSIVLQEELVNTCSPDTKCNNAQRADYEKALAELQGLYADALEANPGLREPLMGSAPIGLKELAKQLPRDTLVLSYYVSPFAVDVVAVSRRRDPVMARSGVFVPVLEGKIKRLREELLRNVVDHTAKDSEDLASYLFSPPIEQEIRRLGIKKIIIAPHKQLFEIPFAALPLDGKPLVSWAEVAVVPTLSAIRDSSPHMARGGARVFYDEGDPELRHASSEAVAIAELYDTEASADPLAAEVLTAMQEPGIVHIVGHGARRPDSRGGMPAIALGGAESIDAVRILGGEPLRASTVVLASCEVGRSRPGTEGSGFALTGILVQKGVGQVVAPLWSVQDREATVLMSDFHRRLRRGGDASRALRQAQRRAIRRGENPKSWAGFVVIGG